MPDESMNGGPHDSQGDEWMRLVSNEVSKQLQAMLSQLVPGGDIAALMNTIATQVVEQVIPRLPEINYELAGQKALELARAEMTQSAKDIGSQIEAKAAGGGGNGSGPGAPTSNDGGHFEGDGHDHSGGDEQAAPAGYVFPKVSGAASMGQAFKLALYQDPLTAVNFIFDKLFLGMDKWAGINKTDDVTLLQGIRQRQPELFNMFVPNPWGPEFQKMQQETWNTALRVRLGNDGQGHPAPGKVLDPFVSGGAPNVAYSNGISAERRPLFGESVSPNRSNGQLTEVTGQAMTPEYATLGSGPKSMAEMLVGDR